MSQSGSPLSATSDEAADIRYADQKLWLGAMELDLQAHVLVIGVSDPTLLATAARAMVVHDTANIEQRLTIITTVPL